MKKIVGVIFVIPSFLFGQNNGSYTISGSTSFYNNKTIFLAPAVMDTSYFQHRPPITPILIKNDSFQVKGSFDYPTPLQFSFLIDDGKVRRVVASDYLFTDNKKLSIYLNDFSLNDRFGNMLFSKANTEYIQIRKLYHHLETKNELQWHTETSKLNQKYQIISKYISRHNNSIVSLWLLIIDYSRYGYNKNLENAILLFSDNIKATKPYQSLVEKISLEKLIEKNKPFPVSVFLFDGGLLKEIHSSRYTLIDFWASYCKPCIKEMPELIELYDVYKTKGFNVTTISIDNKSNVPSMKGQMERLKIKWKNFLDESGNQSSHLNIQAIPQNFLVDSTGRLIAKNVSMKDLAHFLTQNLN